MKLLSYCKLISLLFLLSPTSGCKQPKAKQESLKNTFEINNPQATSLIGSALNSSLPSASLTKKWELKKELFAQDKKNVDNIIWYGRFTAYMGDYLKAIEIYSDGINSYPNDPRLYRHRGHRYITIRKFKKAIKDFRQAEILIQGQENKVEPDGMPNAQNTPVSTLHGNIYYHLGLAYYLSNDLPNALSAYTLCLNTSQNPDNVVSATHWIYSILTKLNKSEEAEKALEVITSDMEVIENQSYLDLCQFYKGVKSEKDLIQLEDNTSANDAIKYGLGNWHLYHGDKEKGLQILKSLSQQKSWASFGVIASEADLARLQ